ncbi:MAG: HD domain-containing protein [Candidatus Shapirobacteria bacterium]|jgi:(p)ppGpp synthase/HD superfamily hydrolase
MTLSTRLRKALAVAAHQHDGQYRKNGNHIPFIIHPLEVALLVSNFTTNEDVLISALLHDVIEDTSGYILDQMAADFGSTVANYVSLLTESSDSHCLSWDDRHGLQAKRLKMAPDEVVLIALADKYANLSSGSTLDPTRLWYYRSVSVIAHSRPLTSSLPLLSDLDDLIKSQPISQS